MYFVLDLSLSLSLCPLYCNAVICCFLNKKFRRTLVHRAAEGDPLCCHGARSALECREQPLPLFPVRRDPGAAREEIKPGKRKLLLPHSKASYARVFPITRRSGPPILIAAPPRRGTDRRTRKRRGTPRGHRR